MTEEKKTEETRGEEEKLEEELEKTTEAFKKIGESIRDVILAVQPRLSTVIQVGADIGEEIEASRARIRNQRRNAQAAFFSSLIDAGMSVDAASQIVLREMELDAQSSGAFAKALAEAFANISPMILELAPMIVQSSMMQQVPEGVDPSEVLGALFKAGIPPQEGDEDGGDVSSDE